MASKFVLTGELLIQTSPANLSRVVNQVRSSLKGVAANIDIKVDPRQARRLKDVNKQLSNINKGAREAGVGIAGFGKQSALAIKRFAAFTLATAGFIKFIGVIKRGFGDAIAFERELIKVAQVTGKTVLELKDLTTEITRLSTTLGVGSAELLKVSRILAQTGLEASDVKTVLEAIAKSDLAPTFENMEKTTEGLIASMRQFKLVAGDAEATLGSLNAVSGKFAVESGDLIAAIRRAGGVFQASGGQLNELVALFTSVRATTRESAESIATGLRTIFTRIQRPRTIEFLRQFNIELQEVGKFVGPFKAIERLSKGLSDLDPRDPRFIQIAEEIAGFRQIGKVIPLIQQFDTAVKALGVANDGTTSLTKDASTAQQALAIQIKKVREEFSALIRKIADNEFLRGMINLSLKLAQALVKIGDALVPLIPLFQAFGTVALTRGLTRFLGAKKSQGGQGFLANLFAEGGTVPGVGSRDTVPALLTPGEFVINKRSVDRIGIENLSRINQPKRFNKGGPVGFQAGGLVSGGAGSALLGLAILTPLIGSFEGLNETTKKIIQGVTVAAAQFIALNAIIGLVARNAKKAADADLAKANASKQAVRAGSQPFIGPPRPPRVAVSETSVPAFSDARSRRERLQQQTVARQRGQLASQFGQRRVSTLSLGLAEFGEGAASPIGGRQASRGSGFLGRTRSRARGLLGRARGFRPSRIGLATAGAGIFAAGQGLQAAGVGGAVGGAVSGAGAGAAIGSIAGPIGAAVGGILGGVEGAITGPFKDTIAANIQAQKDLGASLNKLTGEIQSADAKDFAKTIGKIETVGTKEFAEAKQKIEDSKFGKSIENFAGTVGSFFVGLFGGSTKLQKEAKGSTIDLQLEAIQGTLNLRETTVTKLQELIKSGQTTIAEQKKLAKQEGPRSVNQLEKAIALLPPSFNVLNEAIIISSKSLLKFEDSIALLNAGFGAIDRTIAGTTNAFAQFGGNIGTQTDFSQLFADAASGALRGADTNDFNTAVNQLSRLGPVGSDIAQQAQTESRIQANISDIFSQFAGTQTEIVDEELSNKIVKAFQKQAGIDDKTAARISVALENLPTRGTTLGRALGDAKSQQSFRNEFSKSIKFAEQSNKQFQKQNSELQKIFDARLKLEQQLAGGLNNLLGLQAQQLGLSNLVATGSRNLTRQQAAGLDRRGIANILGGTGISNFGAANLTQRNLQAKQGLANLGPSGVGTEEANRFKRIIDTTGAALTQLTKPTRQLTVLQQKLAKAGEGRAAQRGLALQFLGGTNEQRQTQLQTLALARRAAVTGSLDQVPEQLRSGVLDIFQRFGTSQEGRTALGGVSGQEALENVAGPLATLLTEKPTAGEKAIIVELQKLIGIQEKAQTGLNQITQAQIGGAGAAINTIQGLDLSQFVEKVDNLGKAIAQIPEVINAQVGGRIEVIFNGAEVLQGLRENFGEIVDEKIREGINRAFAKKFPEEA